MEEQSITRYEPYNDKYVILYGNKERFDSLIAALKGKWYPKLGAWLVPKEQEKKVSVLVNALMNEEVLDKLRKRGKSRKDQQKYKRENSDDEKSSSEEETQESSSRSRRNSRSRKTRSAEIRKETLLETESSDSGEGSSSDSDFPAAESPRDLESEHQKYNSRKRRMKKRDALLEK